MSDEAPSESAAAAAPEVARAGRDAGLALQLTAAARGDMCAYEAFYDGTIGHARAMARRVLRGGDTDDLLADVYFEAWRTASHFDPARGSAMTWLLTLVRSRAIDLLRQRAAHPSAAGSDHAEADEGCPAPDADPADRLWQQQAGNRLHDALQQISPAERWVLGLAYFRELSHGEIARCTGMPLGTVKSHLLRAQAKLRRSLTR